jgi:hypothetical protein
LEELLLLPEEGSSSLDPEELLQPIPEEGRGHAVEWTDRYAHEVALRFGLQIRPVREREREERGGVAPSEEACCSGRATTRDGERERERVEGRRRG